MGKSIQKKWFGLATLAGSQIVVDGVKFADGTTATNAYIVKQTGSAAYVVQDTALTHDPEIVFMVNANGLGALLPGQCYINATPFGGSALPCYKIAQFRVDIFDVANSIARETGAPVPDNTTSYSWSTMPAVAAGEADLITGTGAVGAILSVIVDTAGYGYITVPGVTFTGGGVGATATAVLTNGTLTGVTVNTSGSGYTTGATTIAAPAAAVTALATANLTLDAVTSVTVDNAGHYYTVAPNVVIGGDGTSATAHAVVAGGIVTSIVVDTGGSGYTAATATIDPPPASVTATAHATISV